VKHITTLYSLSSFAMARSCACFIAALVLSGCDAVTRDVREFPSPDGRYVAYEFTAVYDALSADHHCAAVLPKDRKLSGSRNVFDSPDVIPRLSWKSSKELLVVLWASYSDVKVDRTEKQIGPIKVIYKISPVTIGYVGDTSSDDKGRLRHRRSYQMDGPFRTDTEYDENGKVISKREFDIEGNEIKQR
jgi:hypothetical protein